MDKIEEMIRDAVNLYRGAAVQEREGDTGFAAYLEQEADELMLASIREEMADVGLI